MLDAKHVYDIVQANEQVVSLARMEEGTNIYQLICYVPADTARRLTTGMEIQACPSYVSREEYGYMYGYIAVSYTHLRAHETGRNLVCRLLLEKKKKEKKKLT